MAMKRHFLVYPLVLTACFMSGCISRYIYTEEVPESSLLRRVEVKKIKTGNGERITEFHLLTDTVSGLADSKENKRYINNGNNTEEISHTRWIWRGEKWVKMEGADLPKSY